MSAMSLLIFTKSPSVQNWLGLPTLRSYRIVSYCASIGMVNYIRTESWFSLQYGGEKKGHRDKGTPSKKGSLRISCHLLPIESGRYKKMARVERLCPLCSRSEIVDEFHYLLKCTYSSLSHITGIFLESLYSKSSNFKNMSCKALFLYIMSMCDENITNLSASYIENILNCYKSEH